MTRRLCLLQSVSAAAILTASGRAPGDFARRIFDRVNELRVIRGAGELEWSDPVAACAREQNSRRETLRFAGHIDPERGGVSQRLTTAGVPWARCGENLFREKGYDDPVNFAIVFWWYSLGHQANMLNPNYTHTGTAVLRGDDGAYFVTQIFITRPPG